MTKLTTHLNTNFYTLYREWHYKDIEPRIFVEEMLEDEMQDFRFHCFNSTIGFIQVANATHTHNDLFDMHWQHLDVKYLNPPASITPQKPQKLEEMKCLAHKLATPFHYVRVDLYYKENVSSVFVGELTFTPNGGTGRFEPEHYDMNFGGLW